MSTIQGQIHKIFETSVVSEKFSKRDVVIKTNDQYPQLVIVQFTQDRCDMLDPYNEGQEVDLSYNLRGREWTSPTGEIKYFNTIEGWKIQPVGPVASQPVANTPPVASAIVEDASQDLPF